MMQFGIPGISAASCGKYLKHAREGHGPDTPKKREFPLLGQFPTGGLADGVPIADKYLSRIPKTPVQMEFLSHLSQFTCVPSGSKVAYLNSGSKVHAFTMFALHLRWMIFPGIVNASRVLKNANQWDSQHFVLPARSCTCILSNMIGTCVQSALTTGKLRGKGK